MTLNLVKIWRHSSQGSDMINRKLLRQRLHSSYKRDISMKEYVCYYCGAPGDTEDHCPPLSLADVYDENARVLIRCCYLCNSLLGCQALPTPWQRCEYLKERYLKRWKKDFDAPSWSSVEIDELEGSLKDEVIKGMKRRERALSVMRNIESRINEYMGSL